MGIGSIAPAIESNDFLIEAYPKKQGVFTSALFQFCLIPIYVGFALLLYPKLKPYGKTLSIGFIGFRFMAATFQLFGILLLPAFVLLSEDYLAATPLETAIYASTGEMLQLFRDLTNHFGVIMATGLGNVLFYVILYKRKLVPRWLSLWGVFGNFLLMTAGFLIIFQLFKVVSTAYVLLSLPLVLQEIVLAYWLLTKGFALQKR